MRFPGKKALAVAGGLLVAAVLVAAGATRMTRGPAVEAYTVARGSLVQTVVASGRVESPRRVEIGSQVTGTVAAIPVDEGQAVKAGQLLIALDDSETRAAVDQARFAVAQAEAKLAQLEVTGRPLAAEAMRQAEVTFHNAERQLDRSKELFGRGFIGQAALDEAQRARVVAESHWKAAQVQHLSASAGGTERRMDEAALAQARANLRAVQAKLEQMTIEAPVDGTLIARNVERGNVVQPGKALMVLSPAGATQLVVQIDEKNLNLLALGEAALASADAYPAERFPARVAYINPAVDPLRGSIEVKLAVDRPPAYLLQDMTVSVDVEVARRESALLLPTDAIHDLAGTSPWVLAIRSGRIERQDVKLGARGAGRVEVVAGLSEGERVVPATRPGLHEGEAVHTAAAKPARKP
ncbi:MAG TPA: efflux RND transporter periplasmic adaptor subunit [Usitatibacter sp.]|nr:efflux RND transporter periplasmic adaptor subunit [Usitatibacter sp.]